MEQLPDKKGFSGWTLKLIAIAAMTVDHVTWVFFPGFHTEWYVLLLHVIGRLTAPTMWFFLAEGMHYTHDRKRYAMRLLMFALVSHFAYCFAFGIPLAPAAASAFNRTSILWSFAVSTALIPILESPRYSQAAKYGFIALACLISFPSDWSCIAAMTPAMIYLHRGHFKQQALDIVLFSAMYAAVYFFAIDRLYGALQMTTCLAIPLLARYNGTRGGKPAPLNKWLFYIYYPAHLAVVGILRLIVNGNINILF